MADGVAAVAEGPDGMFAMLDTRGEVSVWRAPGRLLSRFTVPAAEGQRNPSDRLAIVMTEQEPAVVVGSWSGGVAAFDSGGSRLWFRRDIRHVHQVQAIPGESRDSAGTVSVVRDRAGGLVLGPTGGTRRRIPRAQYLAGWPDGSLLLFDGSRAARLAARGEETLWQLAVQTLAILDAVLGEGTALLCTAEGRLTYLDENGVVVWRTQPEPERKILRMRAHPDGPGWIGLAAPTGRPGVPTVVRISTDGQIDLLSEHPGSWVGFIDGGRHLVATSGAVEAVYSW
jgi:hypothetical protein